VFKIFSTCSKKWISLPDCFIDDRLIFWLKCSHSSIWHNFSLVTSWIRLRYTHSCSFPRSGQDCWLARVLERWSLLFYGLTVAWSHALYGQECCLFSKGHFRTSDCTNMTETDIFCHWYLDINNSTVKKYFPFFQRYIQNPVHIYLLGCDEIWYFYPILSVVYSFLEHSVVCHEHQTWCIVWLCWPRSNATKNCCMFSMKTTMMCFGHICTFVAF